MRRPPPIVRREVERFRADPSSMRRASVLIITVTASAAFLGAFVMWAFTRDFNDFWTALWFALQTVTTVGYGDVTPQTAGGRFVASIVMIVAIGFLSIVTAIITSTFVQAAQRQQRQQEIQEEFEAAQRTESRLEELVQRLEGIEQSLARMEARGAPPTTTERPDPPPSTLPPDPETTD
jgi:voltage-gated potassium channel